MIIDPDPDPITLHYPDKLEVSRCDIEKRRPGAIPKLLIIRQVFIKQCI